MVSAPNSGSSGLGSSPGRGHCVVFLGKTLNSLSVSLHPGVYMGTGEFNAAMDKYPIQGGVQILLVGLLLGVGNTVDVNNREKRTRKPKKQWACEAVFYCDVSCVFHTKKEPLVASFYRNSDKHRPDGPLGSCAKFSFPISCLGCSTVFGLR